MSSTNKPKILKAAEKYIVQGKFASAIAEYLKIVKEEPDDVILLNTIGDLLIRVNKHAEANTYFTRVAELYLKNGFTLKAIAMFKKITKLVPDDEKVNEMLANLYLKQGLVADAKAHFKTIAEKHMRSGHETEAMTVYQKIVDFDKKDPEILAMLANYFQKNSPDMARDHYILAGRAAAEKEMFGPSENYFREALKRDPMNFDALRGYLEAAARNKHEADAVALVEKMHQLHPEDPLVSDFLGDAYLNASRFDDAERVFIDLFEKDDAYYARLLDLADRLKDAHRRRALAIVERVQPIAAGKRDAERVERVLESILEQDPSEVQALQILAEMYLKLNETDQYINVQERTLSVYEEQRDWSQGLKTAERLLRQDPGSTLYREKHREMFERLFPDRPYVAPIEEPVPVATASVETVEEEAIELEEESFKLEEEAPAEELTLDSLAEEKGQALPSFELFGQQQEAESTELPEEDLSQLLQGDDLRASGGVEIVRDEVQEGLQEVDFYISMGLKGEAQKLISRLLKEHPANSEVKQRAAVLQERPIFESADSQRALAEVEVENEQELLDSLELDFDRAIDALFGGFETEGTEDVGERGFQSNRATLGADGQISAADVKAAAENAFKSHYDLGTAYKEMGMLEDAEGEFERAYQNVTPQTTAREIGMCCTMLATCKLERGLAAEAVDWCDKGLKKASPRDFEFKALKYQMGRAYEKLGKANKARQCFQELHKVDPNYLDVASKIGG